ncbi:MAG: HsdM family class I SAM-dependent methyltransferase [Luteolibacter sp.]
MKNLHQIKACLEGIGYQSALFSDSVGLWTGSGQVALVAHSRLPKDLRTAAFVVYDGKLGDPGAFSTVRATGAALAIGVSSDAWHTCRIGRDGLHDLGHGDIDSFAGFLNERSDGFKPDSIYRAKAWGRIDPTARQLDFVDAGLMPIVEKDLGDRLSRLLEECVQDLADDLGWVHLGDTRTDEKKAEWLIQAPFWLLAAKALRDKRVSRFSRIDLGQFDDVFARLAKHYRSDESQAIQVPKVRQRPLERIAERIDCFASLELLSAEALGHVYESTLINKATRKKLGTHSTPPWLIDYILGKLRPWIAEMPPEQRFVFEPACGHAGFLVASLRLLDELRPPDFTEPRNSYLRKRLHGVDVDSFSQEVARLALTLADVPNPNGWNLLNEDMFASDIIERKSRAANIVLLNPPFESFGEDGRKGWLKNKAAETLSRIVHNLPPGGVIGFVGPQGILQSKQARDLRRRLLESYEIKEVVLFADKVFEFGQPESTVIIARKNSDKHRRESKVFPVTRVREKDVVKFSESQVSDNIEYATNKALLVQPDCVIFRPELADIWDHLRENRTVPIGCCVILGKGFEHKGADDPTLPSETQRESASWFEGSVLGFSSWDRNQDTHGIPHSSFLNLDSSVILNERYGTTLKEPQALINYAPVSRGPWRLKALIDEDGHPVTSRFLVVRPIEPAYTLTVLWALLNSPLANAFTFCHLSKRDNLVGTLRMLPVPKLDQNRIKELVRATDEYLAAARLWSAIKSQPSEEDSLPLFRNATKKKSKISPPTEDELRILHLRVDAEVMRLYDLPPEMERTLLNLFEGHERKGVPFKQIGYFPAGFEGLNTVAELVTVLADWEPKSARKSELIRLKAERNASKTELSELVELKRLSAARRNLLAPLPVEEARRTYEELLKQLGTIDPK